MEEGEKGEQDEGDGREHCERNFKHAKEMKIDVSTTHLSIALQPPCTSFFASPCARL